MRFSLAALSAACASCTSSRNRIFATSGILSSQEKTSDGASILCPGLKRLQFFRHGEARNTLRMLATLFLSTQRVFADGSGSEPLDGRANRKTPQRSLQSICSGDKPMPCKYGTKEYWDGMYSGRGEAVIDGLPREQYSWYCMWQDLQPFWNELVPNKSARVLIPGVGNDGTISALYDAGWTRLTAFDYSQHAVDRALELFRGRSIKLSCADARKLPLKTSTYDAVLDKGALDAIGIGGLQDLAAAVDELARVIAPGGVVVSISRALEADDLLQSFRPSQWEVLRDGEIYISETGEVSTSLAASLFAWRRCQD